MPETPAKAMVFGPSNLGLATRLRTGAPTQMDVIRLQQQKKARKQAELAKNKETRGKDFAKLLEYSPDKIYTPWTEWQIGEVNKYYDEASKLSSRSGVMSNDEYNQAKIGLKKRQIDIDAFTNKMNSMQDSVNTFITTAKGDDELSQGAVDSHIGEIIVGEDGQIKLPTDFNEEDVQGIWKQRDIYNTATITKHFADKLDENIFSFVDPTMYGHDELTVKAKFFEVDENGEPTYDENGEPNIKLSPELLNIAKKQDRMGMQIQWAKEDIVEEEGRTDVTDMEAFTKLMKPFAYREETRKRKESALKRQLQRQRYGRGKKEDLIIQRKKLIDAIQKGDESSLDALRQGVYNKQPISDVIFDPSGAEAEIVLLLADGAEERLSLGERAGGSFNILNTIMNTVKGQERFSIEELTKAPKVKGIKQVQDIDTERLNADISTIQKDEVAGAEVLKGLDGVTDVEYDTPEVEFKIDGIDKKIDLSDPNSFNQLKKIILDQSRRKYTITPSEDRGILD